MRQFRHADQHKEANQHCSTEYCKRFIALKFLKQRDDCCDAADCAEPDRKDQQKTQPDSFLHVVQDILTFHD